MKIYSQSGTIEEPLAPLAEILPEDAKKALLARAQRVAQPTSFPQRIRRWYSAHQVAATLATLAVVLLSGAAVWRYQGSCC